MIDQSLANMVRDRAGDRCEYCLLRQQDDPFFRFHIEHIIPKQHSGRATIAVLNINSVPRLDLRAQLLANGRWP